MQSGLPKRQEQLLKFLGQSIPRGRCPTRSEIGEYLGLKSVGHVNNILKALEKKGHISRDKGRARSLSLINPLPDTLDIPNPLSLPLIGTVAAGTPILATENVERHVTLDRFITGGAASYLLRVKGNSMIGAGIHDRDLVVVRKQNTANAGDIIVALLDEEATIKYYRPRDGQIWLEPANDKFSAQLVRDLMYFRIQGKVIGAIRNLEA